MMAELDDCSLMNMALEEARRAAGSGEVPVGAVLVIDAADLGFHHGTAGHGREQDTTQCVAQGVAEATLEGLEHDLRVMCADLFDLDVARTKKLGH